MKAVFAERHVMVRDGLRPFIKEGALVSEIFDASSAGDVERIVANAPRIDLAILDMDTLGDDFSGCAGHLLDRHPRARLVALGAMTDSKVITRTLALGAAGYIPKRLNARVFVSALKLIMAGECYVPASVLSETGVGTGNRGRAVGHAALVKKDNLTAREADVLRLLREGLSNKVIAHRLDISEVTVKSHLVHVFRKLGARNRLQAVTFADTAE